MYDWKIILESDQNIVSGPQCWISWCGKKPGTEIILSGVVKYTDENLSYDQLVILAMNNEIELRYTTLDEDEFADFQMR